MGDSVWDSRAPNRSKPSPPSIPGTLLGGRSPLKVTDEQDGIIPNRGYSYWPQSWINPDGAIYAFAGCQGDRPHFFRIVGGQVERLGPLLRYAGESEGWQWDAAGYIHVLEGPRIHRVNPFTQEDTVTADLSTLPQLADYQLWQMHVSDDWRTYTATVVQQVESGAYPKLGTIIFQHGVGSYFPAKKDLDESHLTRDGQFVVILEGSENRVVDLDRQVEFIIPDENGAVGHADCGDGIIIGEADKPEPGQCVLWDLRRPLTLDNRRILFNTRNMGHISVRGNTWLISDSTSLGVLAHDGSGVTPFLDHGMVIPSGIPDWEKYNYQVFGNLDPSGRLACYVTNSGTDRMDLWMVEIP